MLCKRLGSIHKEDRHREKLPHWPNTMGFCSGANSTVVSLILLKKEKVSKICTIRGVQSGVAKLDFCVLGVVTDGGNHQQDGGQREAFESLFSADVLVSCMFILM